MWEQESASRTGTDGDRPSVGDRVGRHEDDREWRVDPATEEREENPFTQGPPAL